MRIARFDHIMLTVADVAATCDFYARALGMEAVEFAGGRKALRFGQNKINLQEAGREFEPKARRPTPGSADLCLIAETPLDEAVAHLNAQGVAIELGPVERDGALGAIRSFYFRDPDGNLVEVSEYARGAG